MEADLVSIPRFFFYFLFFYIYKFASAYSDPTTPIDVRSVISRDSAVGRYSLGADSSTKPLATRTLIIRSGKKLDDSRSQVLTYQLEEGLPALLQPIRPGALDPWPETKRGIHSYHGPFSQP